VWFLPISGKSIGRLDFPGIKDVSELCDTFLTTFPAQRECHAVPVQSHNKGVIQMEVDWEEGKKKL